MTGRTVIAPSIEYNLNTCGIITNREINMRRRLGYNDRIKKKIYKAMDARSSSSDTPLQKYCGDHGAIFNLEFSADGHFVAAACEKQSVLLFDASNQKLVHTLKNAHAACVNNVRFLDDSTFATCSDDTSVKLWDTRKLTQPTTTMLGHSNWVKNIDYVEQGKILITSALDGSIYVWDLQNPTEGNVHHESLLLLHGITRSRLTPDHKKLILCTTSGYIIIVHDLDITSLCTELKSFRPNIYRLMQVSSQTYPCSTLHSYLFDQERTQNRLEFIDDFPIDTEIITSLEIHPMGWCALTRSISSSETHEWTAVHDIQTRDPSEYEKAFQYVELGEVSNESEATGPKPTDIWIGFTTQETVSYYRAQHVPYLMDGTQSAMGIINSGLIGYNVYERYMTERPQDRNRIVMNLPRLTHYASDELYAKGFIKEMCFSNDGRIICSPHKKGVRLLGFNEKVEELCYCVQDETKELYEITVLNNYHSNYVLSSKFSPVHYQLVTGCRNGEIVWYKPFL